MLVILCNIMSAQGNIYTGFRGIFVSVLGAPLGTVSPSTSSTTKWTMAISEHDVLTFERVNSELEDLGCGATVVSTLGWRTRTTRLLSVYKGSLRLIRSQMPVFDCWETSGDVWKTWRRIDSARKHGVFLRKGRDNGPRHRLSQRNGNSCSKYRHSQTV